VRDIWIRRSTLRLATGLLALAIIAAILINWRWGTGRDAAPPPAGEGKSGYFGIMPADGIALAPKRHDERKGAAELGISRIFVTAASADPAAREGLGYAWRLPPIA